MWYSKHFDDFLKEEAEFVVKHPNAPALFKREVGALFMAFRKYLSNKLLSYKGMNVRDFERFLENEKGYVLVTNKR